jgi:nucleoid DNA-binding protein
MKKTELVARLAMDSGVSQNATMRVLNTLTETIIKTIKKDKRFPVSGFGVFHLVKSPKRICCNPLTREPVHVKAHRRLTFKPSRAVKEEFYNYN